jgi:hypothetical protein
MVVNGQAVLHDIRCWVNEQLFHLVLQRCMQLWKRWWTSLYCHLSFVCDYPRPWPSFPTTEPLVPCWAHAPTLKRGSAHSSARSHSAPESVCLLTDCHLDLGSDIRRATLWSQSLVSARHLLECLQCPPTWCLMYVAPLSLFLCHCNSLYPTSPPNMSKVVLSILSHNRSCLSFRYVSSPPPPISRLFLSVVRKLVHVPHFCPSPSTMWAA